MNAHHIAASSRPPVYVFDLLRVLVVRDMKLRYKRSVLGVAWSLLNPLVQLLVFSFVFRLVLPLQIPDYPVFVFIGILGWTWLQSSLVSGTDAIVGNRDLVQQPHFASAILPVVTVTTHLIHLLMALPILFLFLAIRQIPLTPALLALPLVMLVQFALTLGLVYFVATLHVTFRDVQYLVGVAMMPLFYLSPVFYDDAIVPPRYQALYGLNPVAHLLRAYRACLLGRTEIDFVALLLLALFSGCLLVLGYRLFTHASYRFVEEL